MAIAQTHGWQLAEGSAAAYERYLVPVFMDPWAADLIDGVEVAPGQRVLDIACGTGVVTRHAAARVGSGGEVTAVDVNPGMLAVARAAAAGMPAPIRWHEAGAEQLPLADASIDVVLCQQGLQFFYDPAAALAEMRRIARPGGRLGVSTCRSIAHQPGYAALIDALTRHLGADAGTALRSPYALGDADELRALVRQAGFTAIDVRIAVWSARFSSAGALLRGDGELSARRGRQPARPRRAGRADPRRHRRVDPPHRRPRRRLPLRDGGAHRRAWGATPPRTGRHPMTAIHPVYWTRRGLDDAALELLGLGRYAILATENPVIPPRSVSDGQPVRSGSAHLLPEGGRAVGQLARSDSSAVSSPAPSTSALAAMSRSNESRVQVRSSAYATTAANGAADTARPSAGASTPRTSLAPRVIRPISYRWASSSCAIGAQLTRSP
ncbi:MAG: methyltransferase domain-containing protein [Euzebyaceae bacterium]|nr:methyltransferase domain-containing protein [Euzebyaceae bacterium]